MVKLQIILLSLKKISQITIIIILLLFGLYLVGTASITALVPFSQAYDESPLMVCSWAISKGYPLYTLNAFYSLPFYIAKYPPIQYLIQSSFIHYFGITNTPFRFLVILSAIGSALIISGIVVRFRAGTTAGIISALTFLCLEPVAIWIRYSNPHMLALFFELSAAYVILAGCFTPPRAVSFVALVIISLYTNQSLPTIALAVMLAFFLERKRLQALLTTASAGIVWGLVFLAITFATQGGYIAHTIGTSPSFFDWDIFKNNIADIAHQPFFLTVTLVALIAGAKSSRPKFALPIILIPLLWGGFSLGKSTSDMKNLLPASAAVSLALGVSYKPFSEEESVPGELKWISAIVIFITLTLSLYFKVNILKNWHEKVSNIQKYRSVNPASELIKAVTITGVPVFSQLPDLPIYVERLPAFSDPQLMAQLILYGLWDPTPFEEALENRKILAILTRRMLKPGVAGGVLSPTIVKIITKNYKLMPFRTEGYFLYIPKKPD